MYTEIYKLKKFWKASRVYNLYTICKQLKKTIPKAPVGKPKIIGIL